MEEASVEGASVEVHRWKGRRWKGRRWKGRRWKGVSGRAKYSFNCGVVCEYFHIVSVQVGSVVANGPNHS